MPAPSAPTSLTVLHKLPFLFGGVLGDMIVFTASAVTGATEYVFKADGTNVVSVFFDPGATGLVPVFTFPMSDDIVGADDALTNCQIKARNASGDSAWYNPGLTVTKRTNSALTAASSAALLAPSANSHTYDPSTGLVTINFDWTSTDQKEGSIAILAYVSGVLTASRFVTPHEYIKPPFPFDTAYTATGTVSLYLPPGHTYVVRMASYGFLTSTFAPVELLDATTYSVGAILPPLTPTEITVAEGEPFSQLFTTGTSDATLSAVSLPTGCSLAVKTLSGTLSVGSYTATLLVHDGATLTYVDVAITVVAIIEAPATVSAWLNDQLLQLIAYAGTDAVSNWYLTNAPPGVVIGSLTIDSGSYLGVSASNVVAITGVPTAAGIYDAKVSALVIQSGIPVLFSADIRFEISGGLFLAWYHDDPAHRELQLLARTGDVKSLTMTDAAEGLWLKRGDDEKLHAIFRDGAVATPVPLGRNLIAAAITALRFIVRPVNDFDADPYLEFDVTGAETIDGKSVQYFAFPVDSKAIDTAFAALNQTPGAEPGAISLRGSGELTWTQAGRSESSKTFPVTIYQDVER